MSTALRRIAMSVQPSLRGRVFVLLAGLTLCACAGATATYWLAQHYLDATDILRQVNLGQQVGALSISEQLSSLEADALAARQDSARLKDFQERRASIAVLLLQLRASEPLEAGREIILRLDEGIQRQAMALQELVHSQPGQGALLAAVAARHRQAAQEAGRELFNLHTRDADLGVSAMRSLARTATTASLFVIPAGAVLGLLLGWVLLRQVLGPIRQLALGVAMGSSQHVEASGLAAPAGSGPHAGQGQGAAEADTPGLAPGGASGQSSSQSSSQTSSQSSSQSSGQSDEVRAVGELVAGLLRNVDQTQALLKESREHLIQAEKLALVGKLAAGVAHSVRNPLTSVKMRLFSLERGLDLSPGQREDFEVISEEIRHLDTIVRNFLEFSRPPKPKLQHVSPSDVVDMTLVLLKHRLETYGVDVRLGREQPLPCVDLDPEQLKEVLVNLVLNACDAMGENGRLEIVEHTGFMDPLGRVAIVQLTDSGPGIPPDVAESVFQPFFSTKEEGTGLGLAIAKRIMEEHGGYIHLKPSDKDQGACFILVLPIREKVWLRT